MLARLFVAGVLVSVLGLAALEMRLLWPLLGQSGDEFKLELTARISLAEASAEVHPSGLAVSESGTIWVADAAMNRVLALEGDGRVLGEFATAEPRGIWALDDAVLAVDPSEQVIRRISLASGVVDAWHLAPHVLPGPQGVAFRSDGTVVVAVTGAGFVFLMEASGEESGRLGVSAEGAAQLVEPNYPSVDRLGRIYVSDAAGRVVRWTSEGQPDVEFRTRGREAGVFSSPRQTVLDSAGRLWVADEAAYRVWVFEDEGGFRGSWKVPELPAPVGLAISGDRLYVAARDAGHILVFDLPPPGED